VDVGTAGEVMARNSGTMLDLGERALLPGLINAHCHLDYTCLRGKLPPPKSFTAWIRAINAEKAKLSPEDYVSSINQGFSEAKRSGTTTVVNFAAFPELISHVRPPIRAWWCAELMDVRSRASAGDRLEQVAELLHPAEDCGLAPHAPFTASAELYRECQKLVPARFPLLTTHLAESREEFAMFQDAAGPLYEFMREIGRDMKDCGNVTPLSHFLGMVGPARPWLIAHLNELTETDFELLETVKPPLAVVHCPRSHEYFGHSPFPFQRLRALGFEISLGTDSLASNQDLDLFGEMRAFRARFPDVSAAEILETVTLHPARILGRSDALGRIRREHMADLIAVPFNESRTVLFDQVVAFEGVPWHMVAGVTAKE
jgi:cytosine/adenosine deaminase-related metal-dependent hydrolase